MECILFDDMNTMMTVLQLTPCYNTPRSPILCAVTLAQALVKYKHYWNYYYYYYISYTFFLLLLIYCLYTSKYFDFICPSIYPSIYLHTYLPIYLLALSVVQTRYLFGI